MNLPTIEECEAALGEPAQSWAGRCFEIASRLVEAKLVEGRAVYGLWRGDIHPESIFARRSYTHHGWIVVHDHRRNEERVVDPTRWVFEHRRPYLYTGPLPCDCACGDFSDDGIVCVACDHVIEEHSTRFLQECLVGSEYDEGGQRWLAENAKPRPERNREEEKHVLEMAPEQQQAFARLLERPEGEPLRISFAEAMWLANTSIYILGEQQAKALYAALDQAKLGACVPYDARQMMMGGR